MKVFDSFPESNRDELFLDWLRLCGHEIPKEDLCHYFVEFVPYLDKCEFQGCSHIKEEICGVKKAVEEKEIDSDRYNRYCKIYLELKEKEKYKW